MWLNSNYATGRTGFVTLASSDTLTLDIEAPNSGDTNWQSALSPTTIPGTYQAVNGGTNGHWVFLVKTTQVNAGFKFRAKLTVTSSTGDVTVYTVDPEMVVGPGTNIMP